MTEELYYTASPVFEVDGQVRGELARDIVRLQVEEHTAGLKSLEMRLVAVGPAGDSGGGEDVLLYLDGSILDFGRRLVVAIGPSANQRTIFDGYVSYLEISFEEGQEPEVVVCAEDKLMDLRMTPRIRTYENMNDADIAADIAAEHGLGSAVDAQGPVYDRIQQMNMSDLAFLRDRARLLQAEVWVADETLYFQTRDRRQGTEIELLRGTDIISVQACADLAHQRTQINVSGFDAQRRETIDESASEDAIQAEVTGGRTGPSILHDAFGPREYRRVREVSLNTEEAADWARSEMLRRARAFVSVHGVTRGTPDMMVGSQLRLLHMGAPFNGNGYYVTRVCHTYDLNQGHRTQFTAQRPTVGNPS